MSEFDGLDLPGRAELLGISCRECVALGQSDRRLFANPSLSKPGSVIRLKRHLVAGSPDPDLSRLELCTDHDAVRALIVDVLRSVPKPVAWHGAEHVVWIEVGRSAWGWQGFAPTLRAPNGDQPHVIALCGTVDDDTLRDHAAHELAHSWGRAILATPATPMPQQEWTARGLVAAKITGVTPKQLAREQVAEEMFADELARLWGFAPQQDYGRLMRGYAAEQTAAADLVAVIEAAIDADVAVRAAAYDRAAAFAVTEGDRS